MGGARPLIPLYSYAFVALTGDNFVRQMKGYNLNTGARATPRFLEATPRCVPSLGRR